MQTDDGAVLGAERLQRVQEGLQTGTGQTRLERVRRVRVFLRNETEEGRGEVAQRELLGQVGVAAQLATDETGEDGRDERGNLRRLVIVSCNRKKGIHTYGST